MFSFSFDPLAAIFGISGIVGFFFFVSAAKGNSSINTGPKKDFETVKRIESSLLRLVQERFGGVALTYARVDMIRDAEGQLRLNELELVEPSLFFRHDADSPKRLVEVLKRSFDN